MTPGAELLAVLADALELGEELGPELGVALQPLHAEGSWLEVRFDPRVMLPPAEMQRQLEGAAPRLVVMLDSSWSASAAGNAERTWARSWSWPLSQLQATSQSVSAARAQACSETVP